MWKANTLLADRNRGAHFAPTIVMRRAGGMLQCGRQE